MPMRIGVNSGSLEKDLVEKYGYPCPEALVTAARRGHRDGRSAGLPRHHRLAEGQPRSDGRGDLALFASKSDYPTHVGITEAGHERYGTINSARARTLLRRHRRHDPRLAAGDLPQERSPPGDILSASRPTAARGRRLPDLRPSGHRPGGGSSPRSSAAGAQRGPDQVTVLGCLVNGFGEACDARLRHHWCEGHWDHLLQGRADKKVATEYRVRRVLRRDREER